MMKKRTPSTPKYLHHKPTGQAYVEFDGRRHYLGKHDLPETQRAYHCMVEEWLAGGYRHLIAPDPITVLELADAYTEFACGYYHDARTGVLPVPAINWSRPWKTGSKFW